MDNIKQFTNAILQGANLQAPTSNNSALGNSFMGAFRAAALKTPGQAQGVVASQKAKEEEERAEAARRAQIQALQDQLDPSKYEKRRKEDGGFAFFDPNGKEIDISTFANRTGQRRVDILKDSENPIDQQYISDWEKTNEVAQAIWNGDTDTLQSYVQNGKGINPNDTPENLMKELAKKYPHIYGQGSYQKTLQNTNQSLFKLNNGTARSSSGGGAWRPS